MNDDGLSRFRRRSGEPPVLHGHRGVRGRCPENTMAAFERAVAEGADALELDVRPCRSGEIVVCHDPTLERVTEGRDTRAVADLDARALRGVDVGSGERVPLLADVLALARERGIALNIEMKRDVPSRTRAALGLGTMLRRAGRDHALVVSSFDPPMLALLRIYAPLVPLALLVHRGGRDEHVVHLARRPFIHAVHLESVLASREQVASLKRRGLVVAVWTVNDANEARKLSALGVDALITDEPARIRAALGRALSLA
jgi:glycerophosphoryl diester phosphodiesterase